MINPNFIVSPLVGAAIGWFTNDLAIKMIFRPLYPKYIGKWKLPLTPGLIPKEKNRIAKAIGETANTLISVESLEKTLLSEEIITKIETAINDFISKQMVNDETLNEFLCSMVSIDTINEIINNGKETVGTIIKDKLSDTTFSDQIANNIVSNVSEKIGQNSFIGKIDFLNLGNHLLGSIRNILGKTIHNVLQNNTETIVHQVVDNGIGQLMDSKMSRIFSNNQNSIENIKQQLINGYRKSVVDFLPRIMSDINLPHMIENKINEMDIAEVEAMLMGIIRKELKAIVRLGAVLGFIMGFVTAFLNAWLS